jgi:hypothetical protein
MMEKHALVSAETCISSMASNTVTAPVNADDEDEVDPKSCYDKVQNDEAVPQQ